MISQTVVELSRWQFAITAMLHFMFIPLTLGLGLLLALMETTYVFTGKTAYKAMARFWGKIFAINFLLAVATRLVVAFQFGMSGSYFSLYVGDVFALPLAIEALTSFFLAAALFGPYWFGWDRLGKYPHLIFAWVIAIAVNMSAYWVMVANGWMQNPLAATFNYQSYRMELTEWLPLLTNPAALAKYVHTVSASFASAAATLMAISAYWLKKNAEDQFARVSFKFSALMGVLAMLSTVWLGDATPMLNTPVQQAKLAAINGETYTTLLPDIESRIRSGIQAYSELQELRDDKKDPQLLANFDQHKADLGYALLLTQWNKQIVDVKDKQIALAVESALPAYPNLLYWSYRSMIGGGVIGFLLFVLACWHGYSKKPITGWLLNLSIYLGPLPWLACICGWFVAEVGKQPWAIAGILPTFMSVSSLSTTQLVISVIGFVLAHAALLGTGLYLIRQAILFRPIAKGA